MYQHHDPFDVQGAADRRVRRDLWGLGLGAGLLATTLLAKRARGEPLHVLGLLVSFFGTMGLIVAISLLAYVAGGGH